LGLVTVRRGKILDIVEYLVPQGELGGSRLLREELWVGANMHNYCGRSKIMPEEGFLGSPEHIGQSVRQRSKISRKAPYHADGALRRYRNLGVQQLMDHGGAGESSQIKGNAVQGSKLI